MRCPFSAKIKKKKSQEENVYGKGFGKQASWCPADGDVGCCTFWENNVKAAPSRVLDVLTVTPPPPRAGSPLLPQRRGSSHLAFTGEEMEGETQRSTVCERLERVAKLQF